ncbi:MAG TPA: biotin-dependent carboxyltransferase family protein [Jatrophihabitantaceae bacterium]|nr:biotin-dependent carboxyltransferase family protein [Jatrophihabitantaceae bacterium]
MIEILDAGPLTTVQDGGRFGFAALGVPRSGAFALGEMRLANRLVGNDPGAAVLEVTFGGLAFRLRDAATVALTGAACAGLDWGEPVSLAAGTVIRLARPERGLRTYLAIRGGFAVPAQLGSRSTDTLSGLGPPPLRAGDRLPVGTSAGEDVLGAVSGVASHAPVLNVVPGPRDDWFDDAIGALLGTEWTVRAESNRVGIRLDGPALRRIRTEELPSEPTLPGAIQVPPDGRPILFGPDAPTSGGYPVIGVVPRDELDIAAQLRPGDALTFVLGRSLNRTVDATPRRTTPRLPPPPES